MVESKKVKETEEEKTKKEIVKKVVEELLKGGNKEQGPTFNGPVAGAKSANNGLKARINGGLVHDRRGGCP